MKKIGQYTARGIVTETETEAGAPQLVHLFDGRFDTAYRITSFKVWSSDYSGSSNPDVIGKLSKNPDGSTSAASFFRADDDNQIAWATSAGSGDGVGVQGGVKTLQGLFVTILFPVAPDILKPSLIQ